MSRISGVSMNALSLLAALGLGLADIQSHLTARRISAITTTVIAQAIGMLVFTIFGIASSHPINLTAFSGSFLALLLTLGALSALCYFFVYRAFQLCPLCLVSPVVAANGAITALFSQIFLREVIPSGQSLLLGLVVCGVILSACNVSPFSRRQHPKLQFQVGILYAIGALLGFGLLNFGIGVLAQADWLFPILGVRSFSLLFLSLSLSLTRRCSSQKQEETPPQTWRMGVIWAAGTGVAESLGLICFSLALQSRESSVGMTAIIASCSIFFPIVAGFVFGKKHSIWSNPSALS
jgi:drug/metabolite transporter (DMT)-like permease